MILLNTRNNEKTIVRYMGYIRGEVTDPAPRTKVISLRSFKLPEVALVEKDISSPMPTDLGIAS